jgi:poly(hydroxyalkanoate) depolymerase family esterase
VKKVSRVTVGLLAALAVGAGSVVTAAGQSPPPAEPSRPRPSSPSPPPPSGSVVRGKVGTRDYRLFVPSAEASADRMPLVVALHGCFQTPDDFAIGTRLDAAAEKRGLLVVYPAQSRRDNPSRCWNWFDPRHQSRDGGELGEILAVVAEVKRLHPVREAQAIALGLSAGGFMTVNLACVAPETWSGIGVMAGGPYRCGVGLEGSLACLRGLRLDGPSSAAACDAAGGHRLRAIRASLWHGDLDSVVSAANLPALAAMLAALTGAPGAGTTVRDGASYTLHRDARGRTEIETWLVHGMGHAWSGGDGRGTFTFPPGPDATARMLDFLLPDVRERSPAAPEGSPAAGDGARP